MNASPIRFFLLIFILGLAAGCANIVPPSGGPKDIKPPKLVSVTPQDSLLNTRPKKLELRFDEYVTATDASAQVQISPLLQVPLTVVGALKKVTVSIPDSLLTDNTTYRISFGSAIRDVHEGNPFSGYTYVFSTGSYFDSMKVQGKVFNAATGLPDSSALIVLYSAALSDSAVYRQKPLYIKKVKGDGTFLIDGLPPRDFHIYAIRDKNENMIYDGDGEWIAFTENTLHLYPDSIPNIKLRMFPEGKDTSHKQAATQESRFSGRGQVTPELPTKGFSYAVDVDTNDVARRRTLEVNKPLSITFNKPYTVNKDKIFLGYDSAGITVESPFKIVTDTANKNLLKLQPVWKENTVYTLRLIKGFAKDSAAVDAMPSRYTFRTKREDDYGKLHIHLPSKYYGKKYLLQVVTDKDTIYQKPVTDTMVNLQYLSPATYTFRIIVDSNENGKWDTGNFLQHIQPELVIPYEGSVYLKPGWENIIDFEK